MHKFPDNSEVYPQTKQENRSQTQHTNRDFWYRLAQFLDDCALIIEEWTDTI